MSFKNENKNTIISFVEKMEYMLNENQTKPIY